MHQFMAYALLALLLGSSAQARDVINIAQIHRFQHQGDTVLHFFRGVELAVAQTNAAGGVAGKKLELLTQDDGASAEGARQAAQTLLERGPQAAPHVLLGGYDSESALALADWARTQKRLYLATAPLPAGSVGASANRYAFAVAPSSAAQAALLVPDAAALGKKRWALLYPDDARGRAVAQAFEEQLQRAQPGASMVLRQALAPGAASVSAALQALQPAQAEAVFSALLGSDLAHLVRQSTARPQWAALSWVALQAGEPEQLDPLASEMPNGWLVSGYPWYALNTLGHDGFLYAYTKRYKDYPRALSVLGYSAVETLVAALRKTGGDANAERLSAALAGLSVPTPLGPITYRAADHQASGGGFSGRTGMLRGKSAMKTLRWHPAPP